MDTTHHDWEKSEHQGLRLEDWWPPHITVRGRMVNTTHHDWENGKHHASRLILNWNAFLSHTCGVSAIEADEWKRSPCSIRTREPDDEQQALDGIPALYVITHRYFRLWPTEAMGREVVDNNRQNARTSNNGRQVSVTKEKDKRIMTSSARHAEVAHGVADKTTVSLTANTALIRCNLTLCGTTKPFSVFK